VTTIGLLFGEKLSFSPSLSHFGKKKKDTQEKKSLVKTPQIIEEFPSKAFIISKVATLILQGRGRNRTAKRLSGS